MTNIFFIIKNKKLKVNVMNYICTEKGYKWETNKYE